MPNHVQTVPITQIDIRSILRRSYALLMTWSIPSIVPRASHSASTQNKWQTIWLTRFFQRFECMRHSQLRCWQIQKYGINAPIQFIAESIGAHIAMVNRHILIDAMQLKFIACQIAAHLMEIECVQMSMWLDCTRKWVRQRATARARFDHQTARFDFQLKQNHADVRRVDDLRSMRQRLCPQFRCWLQHIGPSFR